MEKNKIQKLLKKILLENKPKEYCSYYNGKYSMTIDYKNCRIHVSHNPILETKTQKGFFCNREVEVNTGRSCTSVYIFPNNSTINSLYFKFENDEITPYLKKYVKRYEEREEHKKQKLLNYLCDEQT
jgi:hypothetical protein